MNCEVILILLFYFCGSYAFQTNDRDYGKNQAISNFQKFLSDETWQKDERLCVQNLMKTILNFQNGTLWASFIMDSIQLPSAVLYGTHLHLGNFDECLAFQWKNDQIPSFQYCMATIKLTKGNPVKRSSKLNPYDTVETYLNTQNDFGRTFNEIKWGTCLPSSCESHTVIKIMEHIYQENSILSTSLQSKPDIKLESCQRDRDVELSRGAYLFMYLCILLLVFSLSCTYFISDKTKQGSNIAKAFCMKQNAYELVKPSTDDIKVLHGMRVLSAFDIVFIHEYYTQLHINLFNNSIVADSHFTDGPLWMSLHSTVVVDTFYFMSGLLLVKSLENKLENPLIFMLKRYIRFIGTLGFVIFFLSTISINAGNGPLWVAIQGVEQTKCQQKWWANMLMINNYVDYKTMCHPVTWYVASDFQMTIVGVFLYYFHRKQKKAGKILFLSILLMSILMRCAATYLYGLKAIPVYDYRTIINIADVFIYFKTHYRIGAYLIGVAAGYTVTKWKPSDYQPNISKTFSYISFFIFIASLSLINIMGPILALGEYSEIYSALYSGTNRVLYTIIISALLLCEYGFWPIIHQFLSWTAWVPLSRLSYGLYLIHHFVIIRSTAVVRAPIQGDFVHSVRNWFGYVGVSYILSLVVWLLVQAPLNNLTNILLKRLSTNSEKLGQPSKKARQIKNGIKNIANNKND